MTTDPTTPQRPDDPRALLQDSSLTDEQKIQRLEDWRLDLLERQRASEENMTSPDRRAADDLSEQLRLVTSALSELKDDADSS